MCHLNRIRPGNTLSGNSYHLALHVRIPASLGAITRAAEASARNKTQWTGLRSLWAIREMTTHDGPSADGASEAPMDVSVGELIGMLMTIQGQRASCYNDFEKCVSLAPMSLGSMLNLGSAGWRLLEAPFKTSHAPFSMRVQGLQGLPVGPAGADLPAARAKHHRAVFHTVLSGDHIHPRAFDSIR